MEEVLTKFPVETARILQDMIESQDGEYVLHPCGKDLVVENRFDLCFTWRLTLKDVSGLPEKVKDGRLLWCSEIRADGDGYLLVGEAEGPESDECMDVVLRFTDVTVELESVRGDPAQAHAAPWWTLAMLAEGVIRKSEIAPKLLNDRERELLPLLWEVTALSGWRGMQEGKSRMEFPLLWKRLDPELHRLLDQLEGNVSDWKRYFKVSNKLQDQLNRSRYEHIWRGIYAQIAASQAEYPVKGCASDEVRLLIGKRLHALGYSGNYPDFVKTGEIRGLRMGKCRGQTWFVFREKNAAFHIHCREHSCWDGNGQIEFICGTELLRRGEMAGDILSCMFYGGGRRLICSGCSVMSDDLSALNQKISIAVKRAELRGLNREERKSEGTTAVVPLVLIGSCFLAALAIGLFVLVSALVTAVLFGWAEIPAMLQEVPWGGVFFFAWALFGITIAVS